MTTSPDIHGWFHRRLPAFVSGLLAEGEERRFLEHRAQCEDCRRAFDDFTASDEIALTERGAHIPAPMLARWPDARRELKGIERAMVRAHLKRCAECRGDLGRLGHTPELEFVPALEAEPSEGGWRAWISGRLPRRGAARVAEPASSGSHGPGVRMRPEPARRGWLPWALGGWATAATAAVLLLAVVPHRPPSEPPGANLGGPQTVPAPPAASRYSIEALTATARLHTSMRGGTSRSAEIPVGDNTRYVQLTIGPLDLPQGTQLEAEVTQAGRVIARRPLGAPSAEGIAVLFGGADQPLVPGDYGLRLIGREPSAGSPARTDTVEFSFRLERRTG